MKAVFAVLVSTMVDRGVTAWSWDQFNPHRGFDWARSSFEKATEAGDDYQEPPEAGAGSWSWSKRRKAHEKGQKGRLLTKLRKVEKELEESKESVDNLKNLLNKKESEYQVAKDKLVKDLKEARRRESSLAFALQDKKDADYARARDDNRCGDDDCSRRVEAEDKLAEERMKTESLVKNLKETQELRDLCETFSVSLQEQVNTEARRADGLEDTVTALAVDLKAANEAEAKSRRLMDFDKQLDDFHAMTDKWEHMLSTAVKTASEERAAETAATRTFDAGTVGQYYLNEVFIVAMALVIVMLFSLCLFLWFKIVTWEATEKATLDKQVESRNGSRTASKSSASSKSDAENDEEPELEDEAEMGLEASALAVVEKIDSDASTASRDRFVSDAPRTVLSTEAESRELAEQHPSPSHSIYSEDEDSDGASTTEAFEILELPTELAADLEPSEEETAEKADEIDLEKDRESQQSESEVDSDGKDDSDEETESEELESSEAPGGSDAEL